MQIWILLVALLLLLEFIYIKLADKLNIIDKPNLRSSHTIPVVRGGGIIFPIAWLINAALTGWKFPYFTTGLLLISLVSFWDDMRPLSAGRRFIFHVIACVLLFFELSIWDHIPIWGLPIIFLAVIGILNAFNFMDGINGMTGFYGLSFLLPLVFFMSAHIGISSIDPLNSPIVLVGSSIMVFGFFNFRKRARCFAGDVGSISIGFILVFFLLLLMTSQADRIGINHTAMLTHFDPIYILMFSVYGVDTVLTIMLRLKLRENIFEAHRKHLYQYLANELKMPHLSVSFIYGLTQLIINVYVMSGSVSWWGCFTILTSLSIVYIVIKSNLMRRTTHLI